jgi:hypothetical protein
MIDDEQLTKILIELSGIAQAPMTAEQREMRATPVLTAAGVSVGDIVEALRRSDLPWNAGRASSHGITQEQWQQAIEMYCNPTPSSVPALLDVLHRIEAAAPMLKAGYHPVRGAAGLNWSR